MIHTVNGHKVETNHDYPPIPIRSMDWSATSPDFDADWRGEEDGWVAFHPIGHGRTEQEAIADYLSLIEEGVS